MRPVLEHLEDTPEATGARLKRVREILELERQEFAGRAGISPQAYGPVEKGKRPLSYGIARKLKKTYGLPLEFMYFGQMADELPHKIAKEL